MVEKDPSVKELFPTFSFKKAAPAAALEKPDYCMQQVQECERVTCAGKQVGTILLCGGYMVSHSSKPPLPSKPSLPLLCSRSA